MLGLTLWFLAGVGLSVVHLALLVGLVGMLDPAMTKRYLTARVMGSFLIRYVSLGLVLFLALRQSIGAGIAVALGVGVTRWVGAYMGFSGKVDWARFQ